MCTLETIELRSRSSSIHHGAWQYTLNAEKFYTLVFNLSRANSMVRRSRMITQIIGFDDKCWDGPSSETFKCALDAAILTILCDKLPFYCIYITFNKSAYFISLHTNMPFTNSWSRCENDCFHFAANLSDKCLLSGWSFCNSAEYQWNSRYLLK